MLSGNNSLKTFREIDQSLTRLHAMAKTRFPDDSDERRGIRMAVATMGAEPLAATMANSFLRVLKTARRQRVSTLGRAAHFPDTGLLSIGRECREAPVGLGGGVSGVRLFEVDLTRCLHEDGTNPSHILVLVAMPALAGGFRFRSGSGWLPICAKTSGGPVLSG